MRVNFATSQDARFWRVLRDARDRGSVARSSVDRQIRPARNRVDPP